MINRDRAITTFISLLAIKSPSRKEGKIARHLKKRLVRLGAEVIFDRAHLQFKGDCGNLIATFHGVQGVRVKAPPSFCTSYSVAFSAHMDSCTDKICRTPIVTSTTIKSDGSGILGADDKAGICAILEGVESFLEKHGQNHPPFQLIFTVAEECGLMGSRNLDTTLVKSRWIFVLDGDQRPGTILNRGPGQTTIQLNSVNKQTGLTNIERRNINKRSPLSVITSAPRPTTDSLSATATTHPLSNSTFHRKTAFTILSGFSKKAATSRRDSPVKNHQKMARKRVAGSYYIHPEADICHFCFLGVKGQKSAKPDFIDADGISDCQVFNDHGFQSLNLGVGVQNCHTDRESLKIDHLIQASDIVFSLLERHTLVHGK